MIHLIQRAFSVPVDAELTEIILKYRKNTAIAGKALFYAWLLLPSIKEKSRQSAELAALPTGLAAPGRFLSAVAT